MTTISQIEPQIEPQAEQSPNAAAVFFLVLAAGLWLAFDRFVFPISVYWPLRLGYAAIWLVLAGVMVWSGQGYGRFALLAAFAAVIVLSGYVDYDSRKPFLRDFQQVQVGMSAVDVEAVMADYGRYITIRGEMDDYGRLLTGTMAFGHTHEGWGDADVGLVEVVNGRVVATKFSPD